MMPLLTRCAARDYALMLFDADAAASALRCHVTLRCHMLARRDYLR